MIFSLISLSWTYEEHNNRDNKLISQHALTRGIGLEVAVRTVAFSNRFILQLN